MSASLQLITIASAYCLGFSLQLDFPFFPFGSQAQVARASGLHWVRATFRIQNLHVEVQCSVRLYVQRFIVEYVSVRCALYPEVQLKHFKTVSFMHDSPISNTYHRTVDYTNPDTATSVDCEL